MENEEERLKRLAEIRKNHEAILGIHGENITRNYASYEHSCNYHGCKKAGSISHGTKGGDDFYCSEHFRMA